MLMDTTLNGLAPDLADACPFFPAGFEGLGEVPLSFWERLPLGRLPALRWEVVWPSVEDLVNLLLVGLELGCPFPFLGFPDLGAAALLMGRF